jgi:hypothetical protein
MANKRDTAENPSIIIKHMPDLYNHCGEDLFHDPATFILRRKVVDIPQLFLNLQSIISFKNLVLVIIMQKLLFQTMLNRL